MKWEIKYYNESIIEDIMNFPIGIKAKYVHLTDRMEKYGANLGMPHTKALKDGLFELRLKGKEGIGRVFYCTLINRQIIMLNTFLKKSQKIPPKELKIAMARMKEVKTDANT